MSKRETLLPKIRVVQDDAFTLLDGNSNNRSKVGTFYTNLNNTVSNANWNNGATDSYL